MSTTYRQSKSFDQQLDDAVKQSSGFGAVPTAYTAAHTIDETDIGKTITISNASGVACTYPQDSANDRIPIGASGRVIQLGAGLVTHTAGSGTTLRLGNATAKQLQRYGVVRWEKISANTYSISGDLALS